MPLTFASWHLHLAPLHTHNLSHCRVNPNGMHIHLYTPKNTDFITLATLLLLIKSCKYSIDKTPDNISFVHKLKWDSIQIDINDVAMRNNIFKKWCMFQELCITFANNCVLLRFVSDRLYPPHAGLLGLRWSNHDDVIKWKHFPRYWPFVRGIHRSPGNSPHKGQWRGALMFSLICV